jgi:hypothetical protein
MKLADQSKVGPLTGGAPPGVCEHGCHDRRDGSDRRQCDAHNRQHKSGVAHATDRFEPTKV